MEHHGVIESFTDLEDAFHFLDHKLIEFVADGWIIRNGTGVERIDQKWRVGILLQRGKDDIGYGN